MAIQCQSRDVIGSLPLCLHKVSLSRQVQVQWSRLGQPERDVASLWAFSYVESTLGEMAGSGGIEEMMLVVCIF